MLKLLVVVVVVVERLVTIETFKTQKFWEKRKHIIYHIIISSHHLKAIRNLSITVPYSS